MSNQVLIGFWIFVFHLRSVFIGVMLGHNYVFSVLSNNVTFHIGAFNKWINYLLLYINNLTKTVHIV